MRRSAILSVLWLCLLAAVSAGGCASFQFGAKPKSEPAPETKLWKQADALHTDLAAARKENDELKAQVKALTAREAQLAENLRQQQFVSEQLDTQIKTLSKAPGERDAAQARCQELEAEVLRLKGENAQLQKRLEPLGRPAGIAPTTAPAAP